MKTAAEQKDPDAQYNLGVVYEYGMGVPANAKEAARWYQASGRPRAH